MTFKEYILDRGRSIFQFIAFMVFMGLIVVCSASDFPNLVFGLFK